MRRPYLFSVLAAAVMAAPAFAGSVSVPIDEARVVSFPEPVAKVFVGNPSMADITMIDSRHAYLLGRVFGATNIIALNAKGQLVSNMAVTVRGHSGQVVTLDLGSSQRTLACAGNRCEAAQVPGDDKTTYYDPNHQEDTERVGLAGSLAAPH